MDDPKVHFLYKVLNWLDEWKTRTKNYNSDKLTAETHGALHQTPNGLIEVARYCFRELNLSYVLLGKIQTDDLEDHFGKYRQLAGGNAKTNCAVLFRRLADRPLTLKTKMRSGTSLIRKQADRRLTAT